MRRITAIAMAIEALCSAARRSIAPNVYPGMTAQEPHAGRQSMSRRLWRNCEPSGNWPQQVSSGALRQIIDYSLSNWKR